VLELTFIVVFNDLVYTSKTNNNGEKLYIYILLNMKTLFLFIPNFVFSSDLLRTNFIKYISQKYQVIVFSPIFKSNPSHQYYQSSSVEYINWDVENPRFWLFFTKTLRISLIREFDNLEYYKIRRLTKKNLNWQRKLLRSLGWFVPRPFLTADFFTKLENFILPNQARFKKMIVKYSPELLLTATPGFSSFEAEAIIMAGKNGLKAVSINSSWDNYASNAIQLRKTDYLVCWNKVMKEEALSIHNYPKSKVFVSGIYRFDHHFLNKKRRVTREDYLISKGLDPRLKTLLFATVPPNTYPHQYRVWREIIEMRDRNEFGQELNIFIRLHPNDKRVRYEEFEGIKNLHIALPGKQIDIGKAGDKKTEMDESDLEELRFLFDYTDININFRSSMSLESTIYGQPIINLALYDYSLHYHVDHYIPILKSGGVKLVTDKKELSNSINNYLSNPNLDKEGRKKIFDDYIGFSDGLSPKRCIDALFKMIQT